MTSIHTYGKYCPIAKAAEVLGDRWTLLILRDMHTGALRFNDLHRGLPGISDRYSPSAYEGLNATGSSNAASTSGAGRPHTS